MLAPYQLMCPSFNVYGLWVFICMRVASVESEPITWEVKSQPIVFGEDVQLVCNGNTCQPNTIKKWIGGPSYELLCYVGYSANPAKYEIMVNDTFADFGMIIKNIIVEDTLCMYTCACGFQQHTRKLDLEGVDYIYPPDIHHNTTMQGNGKYQIEIQLEVYPFPNCVLTYERKVVPVNITKHLTKHFFVGGYLQLYQVRINHTMNVHSFICKGELDFTCNVGTRNYTLIHQNVDWCNDKIDTTDNFLIPLTLILIGGFALLVVFIVLMRYRCKRGRGRKEKHTEFSIPNEYK